MTGSGTTYGWHPAPVDHRPQLDQLMARMRVHDPRPWGARPAVLPCVALVVLIMAGRVLGAVLHADSFAVALTETIVVDVLLYGGLGAAVYVAGRGIAARYAGWGWAFGIQRPRAMDAAWIAAGAGMVLAGRLLIAGLLAAAHRTNALEQARNLSVDSTSPAVYATIGVLAVLVAPVVEEIVFRGLLLRTFMRRVGFWPAALASSAIFAGFHTYEVDTLDGAVVLALVVFVLGMANCLLVRWSGRVTAGIVVHAAFNALALAVLISTNS